jgi:hypothetical protein
MAHCSSCGSWIPDDHGNSCSMCYGDPYHGHDGYYLAELEADEQRQQRKREIEREIEAQEENEINKDYQDEQNIDNSISINDDLPF